MDEAVEEEELPFLDIEQYKDYRVPVKVDGEEQLVPIHEAVAGYQRQSDYTRKTQDLSKLKEEVGWGAALKAALDTDPEGTIQLLMANYGVGPKNSPAPSSDPWDSDDDSWSDPADKRYAALEAQIRQLQQERQTEQLKATINSLQSRYEDFNPQEVVAAAMRLGTNDLEGVYKMLTWDKVAEKARKAEAAAAAAAARKAQTTAAKREASVVSGGSTASRSGANDVGPISSVHEAYAAAKKQLGVV
jgi:hypothetical protein